MLYEPPPQVNEFKWIWQRWLYGLWEKFNSLGSTGDPAQGDALVGVLRTDTGAVAETVHDFIENQNLNAESFGATGDGVTDDTIALQAAMDAAEASGLTLELKGGANYITAGSSMDCSCNINGNGATITGYVEVSGSNLSLRNFNIISLQDTYGLYLHGQSGTRYENILVEKIKITFDAGVAVAARLGMNCTYIDDLTIRDCDVQYGVALTSCYNYMLHNNLLDGDTYQNNNELLHCSIRSYGIISNNTFKNSKDNFIDLYSSGERTVITGNRFMSCVTRLGYAVELKVTLTDDSSNTSSDTNGWEEQIIFTDNYFYDTQPYANQFTACLAIYYLDSRGAPSFSWANAPRNIIVANNIFDKFTPTYYNGGGAFTSYGSAMYIQLVDSVIVSGNIVRDWDATGASSVSSGIWLEACRNANVTNNDICVNAGAGITIHSTTTASTDVDPSDITIANNTLTDDLKAVHEMTHGIRILQEGSRPVCDITGLKILGNTISASTAAIYQLDTHGSIRDAVISNNVTYEHSLLQDISESIISNNLFEVSTTGASALSIGATAIICAHMIITGNKFKADSGTPQPGLLTVRLRSSIINGNIAQDTTYGMYLSGTSSANEQDDLSINDNYSISQTQTNFPHYASWDAADTATLVTSNNQKTT